MIRGLKNLRVGSGVTGSVVLVMWGVGALAGLGAFVLTATVMVFLFVAYMVGDMLLSVRRG